MMDAGPDLDRLVAEKVMGWEPREHEHKLPMSGKTIKYRDWYEAPTRATTSNWYRWQVWDERDGDEWRMMDPYWSPSTMLIPAWLVVERLRQQGWLVRIQEMPDGYPYLDNTTGEPAFYARALCHLFWVPRERKDDWRWRRSPITETAPTTPHAICLAALSAVNRS